jgi:hypothetical protein
MSQHRDNKLISSGLLVCLAQSDEAQQGEHGYATADGGHDEDLLHSCHIWAPFFSCLFHRYNQRASVGRRARICSRERLIGVTKLLGRKLVWIRNNMMHENNTMSQHKSRSIAKRTWKVSDNADKLVKPSRFELMVISLFMMMITPMGAWGQSSIPVEESLDAFNSVEGWVRDWQLPDKEDAEAQCTAVSAAIVTLRIDGKVFGRGSAGSLDPSPSVVWEAANKAMQRAGSKLTGERDAMWESFIADLSARVVISVELGDELVPMSDSQLELPGFGYTPGVLGVVVRRGEMIELAGTDSMLTGNRDMARSAQALANSLSNDGANMLATPRELVDRGFTIYRYVPVVLAQPAVGLGATFMDRGGRVINTNEISRKSVSAMSEQITRHLLNRRWAGVEHYGLMGTLDPVTGRSESSSASPFEQALTAYALLRGSEKNTTAFDREVRVFAVGVLEDLARVEESETAPWDNALGACMTVVALSEIQLIDILGNEELDQLRTRCIKAVDRLYSQQDGFDSDLPRSSYGLVAHGLVRSRLLDPEDRQSKARSAIEQIFDEFPPAAMVSQMPFLGWAQLELGVNQDQTVERDGLMQMRELVWEHQLKRDDLEWMDRDLTGGVVFTSAAAPLPSWSTLRPLAFLATMLGNEELTPGTLSSGIAPIELGRHIESLRFLRQLCAEGELMHLYASNDATKWGVRMSLWDQRMPIETGAMALLTLLESVQSFDAIVERSQP